MPYWLVVKLYRLPIATSVPSENSFRPLFLNSHDQATNQWFWLGYDVRSHIEQNRFLDELNLVTSRKQTLVASVGFHMNTPGAILPHDDKPTPDLEEYGRDEVPTGDRGKTIQLYTIAFERSLTPMIFAIAGDGENPILFANAAFLDLTGYTLQEVTGRDCRFLQGPDSSKEVITEIGASIRAGREVKATILNYRRDGSTFWNNLHVSPVSRTGGKVSHYFASQVDVTESRRIAALEASERRLLKEVDHRAKNLMAVVNSIVSLSKSDDPKRYAASVRERVQTLANVHTLLAEKSWRAIGLDALFAQEFKASALGTVFASGPPVTIEATDAQPVAMIIHELAANATKHGSLGVETGTVHITWRYVEAKILEISWVERGGDALPAHRKPGFGTVMVDALIEKQLKGKIIRKWKAEGLALIIVLPRLGLDIVPSV